MSTSDKKTNKQNLNQVSYNVEPVSARLDNWLKTDATPTLKEFNQTFGDEGMALLIMILIAPSALPVPTGGITHLFEILVIIIAIQIIIGRDNLWVPKKMGGIKIDGPIKTKVMPTLVKFLKKAEAESGKHKFKATNIGRLNLFSGLMILSLTVGAFVSPPFSMLDTLPSVGVILIALSLMNHSKRTFFIGVLSGLVGLVLEIFFSAAVIEFIKMISTKIFH